MKWFLLGVALIAFVMIAVTFRCCIDSVCDDKCTIGLCLQRKVINEEIESMIDVIRKALWGSKNCTKSNGKKLAAVKNLILLKQNLWIGQMVYGILAEKAKKE